MLFEKNARGGAGPTGRIWHTKHRLCSPRAEIVRRVRRGPDAQHSALRPPLELYDEEDAEAETDADPGTGEAESAHSCGTGIGNGIGTGTRSGNGNENASLAHSRKASLASSSARLVAREPWLVRCLEGAWHERPEARPDLRTLRSQLKPLLDGLYAWRAACCMPASTRRPRARFQSLSCPCRSSSR